MVENIALLASITWILTALIKGAAARRITLSPAESQGVALLVAIALTAGGFASGYITGDPFEVAITLIATLFGANLAHDKIENPARALLTGK